MVSPGGPGTDDDETMTGWGRVPCSNKEYSVTLGTAQLEPTNPRVAISVPVRDIIVHPKFWGRTFTIGDLALLQLHAPVVFSKFVQPICLPEPAFDLKVGTQCWVTGWSQAKLRYSGEQEGVWVRVGGVPQRLQPAGPPPAWCLGELVAVTSGPCCLWR